MKNAASPTLLHCLEQERAGKLSSMCLSEAYFEKESFLCMTDSHKAPYSFLEKYTERIKAKKISLESSFNALDN